MILFAAVAAAALSAIPGWGQCARDLGSEALAACSSVLESKDLAPADKPRVLLARADQYKGTGGYDNARKDLDAALALKPDLVEALMMRAEILGERQGRPDLALEDYERVLALEPGNAVALTWDCVFAGAVARHLDTALARCDTVVATPPPSAGAYGARALVRLRLGDADNARKDLDASLALDPRWVSSLFLRGVLRTRLGDAAGGKADIDAATALEPKVAEIYEAYGVTP